ncbi:dTDP-4-dehydrorhamnose reductase [Ohessyouella blattaphilus]|uniref:dTDP-4-dehydrorhamnose reductase n=1 Tax=Ohessyouella blattaphilus TaxID=2949333 RepID=A0ABT1EDE7_9FIRM|nr:dTDP-4-dehydrorhamnose reductase [Ohessyouella blattaphilus]MCP1108673.1 dTDP-4-dehydrorhamnose reductase [Ohessyouella blattaphilus]MCR8562067.1 dTDP-4-dehydrorhamnose reductase [Ohessyouella blattaphilus]
MKILITGAKGQLGTDLSTELQKRKHAVIGIDIDTVDITDKNAIQKVICDNNVDAVIHCAAYTAVDAAEENPELCWEINTLATQFIVDACKEVRAKLLFLSTDYVFDGEGTHYWKPDDERHPLNVYGETKCKAEEYIEQNLDNYFIVRTAWVFGLSGKNFIKTMLRLGSERQEINVVDDQVGSPTYTIDLSILLADMIESEKYGRYHATNEGVCSWYEFAKAIFEISKMNVNVLPVSSDTYKAAAKRPSNSRLDKSKLSENGFTRLPCWEDALKRYLSATKM